MSLQEGQTVHHAVDLRATEFVAIDRSDSEYDEMSVLPGSLLAATSEPIDDPQLPFKVRMVEYFKNSDVLRVGPHAENKATAGFGLSFVAVYAKPAAGADVDVGADRASAYVEIIERASGDSPQKSLGVYLVSQAVYDNGFADTLNVGGKDYQIGLRFKTVYKPYSCLLYTSPSPRDATLSRMPSSA